MLKNIKLFSLGIILFLVTVAVIIAISLLTQPISRNELDGLTWATLKNKVALESKDKEGMKNSAGNSGVPSSTVKGKDIKYLLTNFLLIEDFLWTKKWRAIIHTVVPVWNVVKGINSSSSITLFIHADPVNRS